MPWYRLAFQPGTLQDLAGVDLPMAQRLLDKSKWLASNVDNLRHESIADDLPGLCKYAVGEWRIFYAIDRTEQLVDIHAILHQRALRA
ncbi:MAG: type II toxin-antitoxin system RelE/ParE family toxin [Nitrospira sp.]|nr:type II toxin-antitoxin system RelE/ParE family toxin [Nitrospira sp.]